MDFTPPGITWSGLARASSRFGVSLDAEASERFTRYRDLLLDRGAHFNLTAVRDPAEIERRLFLDALAMVPALDRTVEALAARGHVPARLIDVGTGAGFPGLALKIARPELNMTLIDATAKKVAFLNEAIGVLGLCAVRAVQGRAEDLGRNPAYRQLFDIAAARAVAALPVLLEYVVPFLEVGGTAFLPKGLEIAEELRLGTRAASMLGAEIVSAAALPATRTRLVVVRKTVPTPAPYPRRTGVPSRSPLGERS